MKKNKKNPKILFISQEISPYMPESEMANQGRFLPQAVQERGREPRTFMPKFGTVNERRNQLHEVIRLSGMNLIINDEDHPLLIKVASIQAARLQIYFIDNEDYFQKRKEYADDEGMEFADNDERIIFYIRGVLETVKKLRWTPDIIHCQGWMTALAPLYIKTAYHDDPFFKNSKVVFSLFDDKFNQPLNAGFSDKLMLEGIEKSDISLLEGKDVDYQTLCKFAIDYSDAVIQSSKNVDESLLEYTKEKEKNFLPYVDFDDVDDVEIDIDVDDIDEEETKREVIREKKQEKKKADYADDYLGFIDTL